MSLDRCNCPNCQRWVAGYLERQMTAPDGIGEAALKNRRFEDERRYWRERCPLVVVGGRAEDE